MSRVKECKLFEILIPFVDPEWVEKILPISGGVTFLSPVNGRWYSSNKKCVAEVVTPVRVACAFRELDQIVEITLEHFNLEEAIVYIASEYCMLKKRKAHL